MPKRSEDYKFKFSFVMPIYNVEKYLAETVESILAQTMVFEENCQIVFVNDGSPDNSEEVCLRYQQQFPDNIKYIKQKNQGVSAARNNGIAEAEGKYISLIDPDDKISPTTLTEVYEFFEAHYNDIDFVSIKLEFFGAREGEHPLNYKFDHNRIVDITKDIQDVQLSGATAFFSARVFKENGHKFDPSVGHFGEDMKLMAEVVLDKMAYGIVAKPTYFYRKRGDESALGATVFKKFWYMNTPDVIHNHLLVYYEKKFGTVPRYIQFMLMYDLQWRFKQPTQQILSDKELEQYKAKLYKLLKHIDDYIILSQKNITLEYKIFILGKKHGLSILDKAKRQAWAYYFNSNLIYDFDTRKPPVSIEFFEVKDDQVVVEGYFNSFLFRDLKLTFQAGKEHFYPTKVEQVHKQKRFLGELVYDRNCFKVSLPFKAHQHIKAYLDSSDGQLPLKLRPLTFSGFGLGVRRAYRVVDDKLVLKLAYSFKVFDYSHKLHLKREVVLLRNLIRIGQYGSIFQRLSYYLFKPFITKKIWIISDRIDAAGDNGEALFRYIAKQKPSGIKSYFAISGSSPDYRRMKKFGKVINRDGWLYKLLFMFADKVISSHADIFVTNPYGKKHRYINDLLDFDFVFLQHGVIHNDLSGWLNRYNKNIKLFVTSARDEYKSILAYPYGYDEKVVKLTGLPRYDLLENSPKKKLIIAPTWRAFLAGEVGIKSNRREHNKLFVESDYFNFYQRLINDERIIACLVKHNMTGEFYLHPSLAEHTKDFQAGRRLLVKPMPYDYRTALTEGNLMVTDYSSIAFDFAYLKKPIVYSQFDFDEFYRTQWRPGYFSYSKDGFGPVTKTYDSTVEQIIRTIEARCSMSDGNQKRVSDFFEYIDKENSHRVFDVINEA